jgi:hypothetical protein
LDGVGSTTWSQIIGGSGNEIMRDGIQNSTFGFTLIGGTTSAGAGAEDFLLLQVDNSGQIELSRTYGSSTADRAFAVASSAGGNFLIAGDYGLAPSDNEAVMAEIDAAGNVQWHHVLTTSSAEDKIFDLRFTADGGIITTGPTTRPGLGGYDMDLVKYDAAGNLAWGRNIGGSGLDHPRTVLEAQDGGFYILGHTDSWGAGGWDAVLVKTDSVGNVVWAKTYGGTGFEQVANMVPTPNGLVFSGWTTSFGNGGNDLFMIHTDLTGDLVWAWAYGSSAEETITFSGDEQLVSMPGGGFCLVGNTTGFGASGTDIYVVRTDQNGSSGCNEVSISPTVQVVPASDTAISLGTYTNLSVALPALSNSSWTVGNDLCFMMPITLLTNLTSEYTIDKGVFLTWTTGQEQNTLEFVVEHAGFDLSFAEIGRLKAAGNSAMPVTYTFTDPSPLSGINYYRFKEIDQVGSSFYSDIAYEVVSDEPVIIVSPNPCSDLIYVTHQQGSTYTIELRDALGKSALVTQPDPLQSVSLVDVSTLPAGMYSLVMRGSTGTVITSNVVIAGN